jgi:aspartate/methionine/tyrosine aminotransferase
MRPLNPAILGLPGSVYSALAHRLAAHRGEVYPLHVGDTWLEPAEGLRMQDVLQAEHPGVHRYTTVHGASGLLDACVETQRSRTGLAEERDNVLVSAGATGGLCAVVGAMVAPGDEVLVLAPYWPLIGGMVQAFGGVPVPVPVVASSSVGPALHPASDGPEAMVARLEAAVTGRTVAVYLNTPSNPTGVVLPSAWVEAVVAFAREHDLWILADEVYDRYVYEGEHVYTRPLAPERTVAAYSFSKAFGMAGYRAGYLVGPAEVLAEAKKLSTHTFYSTPTPSQVVGKRALEGVADPWVATAKASYAEVGRKAAHRLGVEAPGGGTFLFLDVAEALDERGLGGLLEDLVEQGLFCAPGPSFGPFPTHVRLCFTAAPPDVVLRGVEVLARRLGR